MRPPTLPAALLVLGCLVPALLAPAAALTGTDLVTPDSPPGPGAPANLRPAADHVPLTADGQVPLVVEAATTTAALAARVGELGGRIQYTFTTLPALAITVPVDRMHELLADPQSLTVERQKLVHRAVSTVDLPGIARVEGGAFRDPALLGAQTVTLSHGELKGDGGGRELTTFLGYDALIGATEVWEDADYGEGTVVVIVDTGVYPLHPLIAGSVSSGMNLVPPAEEEAIDLDLDGVPDGRSFDWNAIENHDHGTSVAGLIAGHADLMLPIDGRFAQSLFIHSPESIDSVDVTTARVSLMGMAPAATLYAIKVFPYDGGSAPDARVAEAIDRVIAMRRSGELMTDVINLSLGGPTLWDGRSVLDRTVDAAVAAGITVVAAAGNEGPSLVTTGSPANALHALAAGAGVDPIHSRVGIEQLFPAAPVGAGRLIYPYEALQVANFSSRGLTGDGRVRPDLLATGFLNFSSALFDTDRDGVNDAVGYSFGFGTSFATPTVAGSAALLAAYGRSLGRTVEAPFLANILMHTASPIAGFERVAEVEQGKGFVHLPAAFRLLAEGCGWGAPHRSRRNAGVAYLNAGEHGFVSGCSRELGPGETFTFIVRVPRSVSQFEISFPAVEYSGEPNPLIGDHLEAYVHSAKRGGNGDYLFANADVTPFAGFTAHLPEPGQVRVTFAGGFTNWGRAAGSFTLRAKSGRLPGVDVSEGSVGHDGSWETTVEALPDQAGLELWLSWSHDWRDIPTYDLDFIAYAPDGTPHVGGVSLRSPERTMIVRPAPGTWRIRVFDMGTVVGREYFRLHARNHKWFDPDVYELTGTGSPASAGADPRGLEATRAQPSAPAGPGPAAGRPALALLGVAPNPISTSAALHFELGAGGGAVRIAIYEASGRRVCTLLDDVLAPGAHVVAWDGRDAGGALIPSGVYFARIEAPAGTATRKLVVAR